MSERMSRRAVLSTGGRAAVATLSLSSLAVASTGEDAELRRLWAEYQEVDNSTGAAWDALKAKRDDQERSLFGGKTLEEMKHKITEEQRLSWVAALDAGYPDSLWERANVVSSQLDQIVKAIRATPAEGFFGLAVKLTALPNHWQGDDVQDSALAAIGDINRILGSDFTIDGQTHFEEWSDDDEDEDDEAGGDGDV